VLHHAAAARPHPFLQILEIKTESQELIAALSTLSAIYPDNTPAARRHLRSTIEERGLGINEQFLEAAEGVTKVRHCTDTLLQHPGTPALLAINHPCSAPRRAPWQQLPGKRPAQQPGTVS
jgi:hypothetical protein